MNRSDLVALERQAAATYRREAARRSKNPALAARLIELAELHDRVGEEFRVGPLFGAESDTAALPTPERPLP